MTGILDATTTNGTCAECRWYEPSPTNPNVGHCHLLPPIFLPNLPVTVATSYCSRYECNSF